MLIVIEGLDGSGKSTQVGLMKNYIESCGKKIEYMHFPRYVGSPVYGDLIARFLRGEFGTLESVHPQLVALLFAEDRHSASEQIKLWLKEGRYVLLDRYVYSNIAYQCSKLSDIKEAKALQNWILSTEYDLFNIPRPDINIFLDVPINFVDKKLKEGRAGDERDYLNGKSDIHEADIKFQIKVRDYYLSLTEGDKNFIKVECSDINGKMLSQEDIFTRMRSVVDKRVF